MIAASRRGSAARNWGSVCRARLPRSRLAPAIFGWSIATQRCCFNWAATRSVTGGPTLPGPSELAGAAHDGALAMSVERAPVRHHASILHRPTSRPWRVALRSLPRGDTVQCLGYCIPCLLPGALADILSTLRKLTDQNRSKVLPLSSRLQ